MLVSLCFQKLSWTLAHKLSSRCQGENHLARDCLAPRDEAAILASKKCYKCQETGHIARDCTKETEELSADIDE